MFERFPNRRVKILNKNQTIGQLGVSNNREKRTIATGNEQGRGNKSARPVPLETTHEEGRGSRRARNAYERLARVLNYYNI